MSNKTLDQMKAPEIVKAIREKDLRVIKILVKDGVKKELGHKLRFPTWSM
jgi:hypothetical protein